MGAKKWLERLRWPGKTDRRGEEGSAEKPALEKAEVERRAMEVRVALAEIFATRRESADPNPGRWTEDDFVRLMGELDDKGSPFRWVGRGLRL